MATLPSALALTQIADGSLAVAADVRNDFNAVQTYANDLRTLLAGGSAGNVFTSSGGTTVGWSAPVGPTTYRKATAKAVNTTVAATDLLNAEITIAAGIMGLTGVCRLTAWGDVKNNSGGTAAPPRIQAVLGGTTLLDTGTQGTLVDAATRYGWKVVVEIQNSGAANAQATWLDFSFNGVMTAAAAGAFTTGEGHALAIISSGFASYTARGVNMATALDTATSKTLVLNTINGSASANYETKLIGALVEIV